jgi:predicted Zn finger-like uncharacterized protein
MTISISCPACGAPYNLNDQMRGKTVRCKSCQDTFTVNGSSKPAPAGIKKGGAPAETRPAARAMPPARGGKGDPDDVPVKKSGGGKVALIVGGVIGVIFLLCCGGVSIGLYELYYTGKNAADQFNKEFAEQAKKGQGGPFDSKDFDAAMKKAEEEMNRQMAQQGNKPGGDSGKKPPDQKQIDDAFKKAEEELKKQGIKPGENPFASSGGKGIKTLDDVVANLNSSDKNKQREAAEWLAKAPLDKGRQDEVAKALDPMLADKNNIWPAFNALQVWATKENVPSLAKMLDADNLQGVPGDHNQKAMQILGKLQDERGAAPVARFMTNFFSREGAVNALRAMGPVAEKAVLKYFKHGDGGVHGAVDNLLLGYGTKSSAIVLQCVEDAKTATNQDDRNRVLDYLAKAKPEEEVQPAVTAGLIPLLKDRNPDVASRTLRALATWENKDTIPAIIAVLDDPSPTDRAIDLRRQALGVLGKSRDERAIAAVAKRLMVDQERGNAAQALKELAATMKPMVEAELMKYVDNDNRAVRDEASNLLKQMGAKDTGEVARWLKELKANDIGQRRGAAARLGEMAKADETKQADVAKALGEALDDPDNEVREHAAKALGVWGTADSVPALLKTMQSQQDGLRHRSIESLGKLKAEQAVDQIAQKLTVPGDRQAASKALQAIGGPRVEMQAQRCLGLADEDLCVEGLRILQAVGTKKSVSAINQIGTLAAQKQKRKIVDAAREALQAINARG